MKRIISAVIFIIISLLMAFNVMAEQQEQIITVKNLADMYIRKEVSETTYETSREVIGGPSTINPGKKIMNYSMEDQQVDGVDVTYETFIEKHTVTTYNNVQEFKQQLEQAFPDKSNIEIAEEILLNTGCKKEVVESMPDNIKLKALSTSSTSDNQWDYVNPVYNGSVIEAEALSKDGYVNKNLRIVKSVEGYGNNSNLFTVTYTADWVKMPTYKKSDSMFLIPSHGIVDFDSLWGQSFSTFSKKNSTTSMSYIYDATQINPQTNSADTPYMKVVSTDANIASLQMDFPRVSGYDNTGNIKTIMVDIIVPKTQTYFNVVGIMTHNKYDMNISLQYSPPFNISVAMSPEKAYSYHSIKTSVDLNKLN